MRDFYKGWRRKIGLLFLAFACLMPIAPLISISDAVIIVAFLAMTEFVLVGVVLLYDKHQPEPPIVVRNPHGVTVLSQRLVDRFHKSRNGLANDQRKHKQPNA